MYIAGIFILPFAIAVVVVAVAVVVFVFDADAGRFRRISVSFVRPLPLFDDDQFYE